MPKILSAKEANELRDEVNNRKDNRITEYPFMDLLEKGLKKDGECLITFDEWKKEHQVRRGVMEKPTDNMVGFLKERLQVDKRHYSIEVIERKSKLKDCRVVDKENGGYKRDEKGNYITRKKRVYIDSVIIVKKLK